MTTFFADEKNAKFSLTNAEAVKKIEGAEAEAEEMRSRYALKVRQAIVKRSPFSTKYWKARLSGVALEAAELLEAAGALTISSIWERLSDIAGAKLRMEKAILENDPRLSYWLTYYESVVGKWKFVEMAEMRGMSIKDMFVISFKNPYLLTYSEEDAAMSCRYWKEQTKIVTSSSVSRHVFGGRCDVVEEGANEDSD